MHLFEKPFRLLICIGLIASFWAARAPIPQAQAAGLITQTTFADFSQAGSVFDGTYIRENGGVDGASIALMPQIADSFPGPVVDSSIWTTGYWFSAGTFTPIIGGGVTIPSNTSAYIHSISQFGLPTTTEPQTVEFTAQYNSTPDPNNQAPENVGLGLPNLDDQFIVFSTFDPNLPTTNTGHLYARIKNFTNDAIVDLGTTYIGAKHRYRIDWFAVAPINPGNARDRAVFYVDGIQVADLTAITDTFHTSLPPLYAYISNKSAKDALFVSNIKVTPGYIPSGSYTSAELDAGPGNVFTTLAWVENKPANSGISVETSSSPNQINWTAFQPVANGGYIPDNNRYIKYRLSLSTSNPAVTPQVDSISLTTDVPKADVNIIKTASTDAVSVGSPYTYTFTVHNYGPDSATGLQVADSLPPGIDYVGFDASTGWDCVKPSTQVMCSFLDHGGSLSNRNSSLVKITVMSLATVGSRSNVAMVTEATADPNPANNSSNTVVTNFTQPADLSLVMSATTDSYGVGQTLTYLIRISNNGPTGAQSLKMVDAVPASMSITAVDGSPDWTCGITAQIITCTLPVLASGATSSDINLTVTLPAIAENLTNSAEVTSQTGDPNAANNTAQIITHVTNLLFLPRIAR